MSGFTISKRLTASDMLWNFCWTVYFFWLYCPAETCLVRGTRYLSNWIRVAPPTPPRKQPTNYVVSVKNFLQAYILNERRQMLLVFILLILIYELLHAFKGHGNEADFLGFLHKPVRHRSLTLRFEPFRFWLRIRGDSRNRKTTPRLAESGIRQDCLQIQFFSNL